MLEKNRSNPEIYFIEKNIQKRFLNGRKLISNIFLGERLQIKNTVKFPERRNCTRCGFVSSQEICKACILLEGLNRGLPKLGIGKSNKVKQIIGMTEKNEIKNLNF